MSQKASTSVQSARPTPVENVAGAARYWKEDLISGFLVYEAAVFTNWLPLRKRSADMKQHPEGRQPQVTGLDDHRQLSSHPHAARVLRVA